MKYKVNIKEVLSRTVEIEADTLKDALWQANYLYEAEKIVLDASDWQETTINKAEDEDNVY